MMGAYIPWRILLYIVLLLHGTLADKKCSKEKKCNILRIRGMRGADCFGKEFKEVPQCLPSSLEIIDLSYNRIRHVSKSDFETYPHLKHLYLFDNLLAPLDEEMLESLQSLETLDIALNGIQTIPPAVFKLPNLKSLYLSQSNLNLSRDVERAKPILSPLTQLDISYISQGGEPIEFPNFGEMPFLASVNITSNRYVDLKPSYFAGLCNLQFLTTVNVSSEFEDECDCWVINNWLKDRMVKFIPFECRIHESRCTEKFPSDNDIAVYKSCLEKLETYQTKEKMKKVGIGIGISLGILLVIVAVVAYKVLSDRKKRRARASRVSEKKNNLDSDAHLLTKKHSFSPNL